MARPWDEWVVLGEIALAWLFLGAFVTVYHVRSAGGWRRSRGGVEAMTFALALWWMLTFAMVDVFDSDSLGRTLLRVVTYGMLPLVAARRFALMWAAQNARQAELRRRGEEAVK